MRRTAHVVYALMMLAALAATSYAQSATDCANLMKFGVYDRFRTFTTESHYKQVKEFFENNTFSSKQESESKAAELGLDIAGVLGLSFGGTTSSSNFEVWRQRLLHTSFQEAISMGLSATTIETISNKITDLVGKCIGQKGVHAFIIPAADNQNFTVTVDFVPLSDQHPSTKGTLTLTPSSVAAQCSPTNILGQQVDIGPQGVSLSCRRLTTDTVTVVLNSDDGSPTFTYDAFVVPPPHIEFNVSKNPINRGETTTLTWQVTNALSVSMPDLGTLPLTSSREVAPTETKEFVLTVISLEGKAQTVSKIVSVVQPPPTLRSARVGFFTTNDNKDNNTNVLVNVICDQGSVATISSNFGGEFRDNTPSGPHNMNVVAAQPKNRIAGCRAHLVEQPVGDDEWHFNWFVELVFSDGSVIRRDGSGNVDSDRPNAFINF